MLETLSNESFDDFPIINTDSGLIDKMRNAVTTGIPFSQSSITQPPGWCERYDFIREFGYFIPTLEFINVVSDMGRKWVSVGCGRGYTEYMMGCMGIDIVSTDLYTVDTNPYFIGSGFTDPYTRIEQIDALSATYKYPDRSIMISWIPMDSLWGIDVVSNARDNLILIIGERYNGCTGHNKFHEFVDNNCARIMSIPHVKFSGINDGVEVYKLG